MHFFDESRRHACAGSGIRLAALMALCLVLLLGAACTAVAPQGVAVRQVVMVSGDEVVVTRTLLNTPRPSVTVTPNPHPSGELAALDIPLNGMPATLDPQQARNTVQRDLIENLFVGLTRFNHAFGTVEPDLALDWQVSDDGTVWTFNLRDDVFWIRPGLPRATSIIPVQSRAEPYRPVIADDVVFAVERACDYRTQAPEVLALFIVQGCEETHAILEPQAEDLASVGVRAIGDYTVEFTLTRPAAYFSTIASLPIMRPIPREVVDAYADSGDVWSQFPDVMTSGRFIVSTDDVSESRTELQRNPYWPTPFSGTVDVVNIYWTNSEEAYELWIDKVVDVSPLPANRREEMLANTRMLPRVNLAPNPSVFYLAFNFDSPVFSDPAIRRAFSAAIDRQALIDNVYGGLGLPMRHFTPPGALGAPGLEEAGVGFFPDWAQVQMAGSPMLDCKFLPEIRYLVGNTDLALFHAETLRSMWMRTLGCPENSIIIEQVQFGRVLAQTNPAAGPARPDIWDLGWNAYYPDAHNWLGEILHCTDSENRQNRPCSNADNLLSQAATTTETAERWSLYREVEQQFFGTDGEYPIAPLFVEARYVLIHPWLDFEPARFGGEQYDRYQLDPTTKRLERQQ